MNYSDTTSALVINKLTKSQYETLKASGSLQSNQIYITPETLPSNLGDFNNDVGYVTASAVAASYATKSEVETVSASVSAIGSSVADLNAKLLDKRDYIDLKYPAVAQDGDNKFGIDSWSYSFPVHGIGYQGTLNNYTYDGEYGVWAYDTYSPKVRTSDGQNFQFASAKNFDTGWTDPLALSQVYPQANVFLQIDVAHGQMNCELTPRFTSTTSLVLENQLSAYATASALESVSANVSAMTSSVSALGSSVIAMEVSISTVSGVVDGLTSTVSALTSSFATLGSSVDAVTSQVSAMTSSISGKRDYSDLTYNTTVPAETIDNSELHWEDTDVEYNAKLTFLVEDSEQGEEHLAWNDGETCWIDNAMQIFMVWYAEDFGYDPADGKFVLVDGADACLQFNLQDGVNVQTFNYESGNYQSTGTLTMTFTGEPAHVVSDTIALNGSVDAVSASVSTLTSQVNANTSAISANASAISANTSAIADNASAISAVAGSLNVSGIGCSTIVLSGTYSDSTSFAYNFVIQPSA